MQYIGVPVYSYLLEVFDGEKSITYTETYNAISGFKISNPFRVFHHFPFSVAVSNVMPPLLPPFSPQNALFLDSHSV